MTGLLDWIVAHWTTGLRALLILVIGLPVVRISGRIAQRSATKRLSQQSGMLMGKAIIYGGTTLLLMMLLREFNFKLTPILGAAGVVGVAVGFAAQTSLSNLISGLFLIAEKPFQVGDVIQVDATTGVVHSVDLLSLKLRTFDNRYIRIPNETLVKTQLTNITRFPIRRLDIDIGVAYKENVEHVIRVLNEVADRNPFCLDEPAPLVIFKGFGDSALEFLFGVWFEKSDMLNLRNSIMREIKERFDAEKIEIPFPHRSLYAGEATAPFPIRIVNASTDAETVARTRRYAREHGTSINQLVRDFMASLTGRDERDRIVEEFTRNALEQGGYSPDGFRFAYRPSPRGVAGRRPTP